MIKMKKWLNESTFVVLALHATEGMRVRTVFSTMQHLGFEGSLSSAKRTLSELKGKFVYQPKKEMWTLTAAGVAHRNQIVRGMQEVLTYHKLKSTIAIPPPAITPVVFRPSGNGDMVCAGCGIPIGHSHDPRCEYAPRLDALVTAR